MGTRRCSGSLRDASSVLDAAKRQGFPWQRSRRFTIVANPAYEPPMTRTRKGALSGTISLGMVGWLVLLDRNYDGRIKSGSLITTIIAEEIGNILIRIHARRPAGICRSTVFQKRRRQSLGRISHGCRQWWGDALPAIAGNRGQRMQGADAMECSVQPRDIIITN